MAAGEQSGHTARDFEGVIRAFAVARNFLVAQVDGRPAGVICSDYKLVIVEPALRRQGIGTMLVAAMETALESTPDGPLILYPPHGNDGALAFLNALGFAYDHSLWRFRLDPERHVLLPLLPTGITQAPYCESDLHSYVELINTSFADHPTPLRVTHEQIQFAHGRADFDPAAIAILREEQGGMVGFCTTGIDRDTAPPVGHINLIGVLQPFRGRGLGRWLLHWGIARLRSQGITGIELAVEAENDHALGLYRSAGFEPVEEWPQWVRAAS